MGSILRFYRRHPLIVYLLCLLLGLLCAWLLFKQDSAVWALLMIPCGVIMVFCIHALGHEQRPPRVRIPSDPNE